jgi:hypothetical protein
MGVGSESGTDKGDGEVIDLGVTHQRRRTMASTSVSRSRRRIIDISTKEK